MTNSVVTGRVVDYQIDTENDTITVNDPMFGNFVLTPNIDKGLIWFGNYATGKLAIYMAQKEGVEIVPCYAIIFVLAGQVEASMDGMGFILCDMRQPIPEAMDLVLLKIEQTQVSLAAKQKEMFFAHGPASLH